MFDLSFQILGMPLSHPDDLSSFDYELHKNAVIWVQDNSVNDLDLSFSVDALNPWNSKPVTIDLTDDSDKKLTDDNKVRDDRSRVRGSRMTNLGEETRESTLSFTVPGPPLSNCTTFISPGNLKIWVKTVEVTAMKESTVMFYLSHYEYESFVTLN